MLYNMYNAHIQYGKADFKIRRIGGKEVTPLYPSYKHSFKMNELQV